MRSSTWLYPLVNTAHLLGIALLLGAIIALDLRLLGCWRSVALAPLATVLRPTAIAGIVLAVPMGVLLFAARAVDYVFNPVFQLKLALVLFAIINAIVLGFSAGWIDALRGAAIRPFVRVAALLSLLLWLSALLFGRLVGYR